MLRQAATDSTTQTRVDKTRKNKVLKPNSKDFIVSLIYIGLLVSIGIWAFSFILMNKIQFRHKLKSPLVDSSEFLLAPKSTE